MSPAASWFLVALAAFAELLCGFDQPDPCARGVDSPCPRGRRTQITAALCVDGGHFSVGAWLWATEADTSPRGVHHRDTGQGWEVASYPGVV